MKFLIKNKDGSVGFMTTTSDEIDPYKEFEKWSQEQKDNVDSHRIMHESEIPEDRYFRNALVHLEDKISFDMDKCRNIHINVLRELRKPKLEALDIEFMRASELNDEKKKNEITIKKNELRNVTEDPFILKATNTEELKSFMPDFLK